MAKIRINKALADAGVASRRKSEELVREGRVSLNGKPVTDLATQVDPGQDDLRVDGRKVASQQAAFYLYYKPRGMVSTLEDELGRECLGDVCSKLAGKPRPVGRLDRASEGVMLLTNDGEVAQRLTHPRYHVQREYQVTVSPVLQDVDAQRLIAGVELEDGPASFIGMELNAQEHDRSRVTAVLAEGRNRIIRRMFELLGYKVRRLRRMRMGPLSLGNLKPGESRRMTARELANLKGQLKL